MKLHYNIISTYSQKALIAFYEKNISFTPAVLSFTDPAARAEYEKIYPLGKVPLLVVDEKNGLQVPESSSIVDYLDDHFPNNPPRLVPKDVDAARQARQWDRFADLCLNETMTKILFDTMRPADKRDPLGVERAQAQLAKAYRVLDAQLAGKTWILGDAFTLADCSALPCLAYLRKVAPFEAHKNIVSYFGRGAERPSFARVLAELAPVLEARGRA
jgi:glutathione S-transferase